MRLHYKNQSSNKLKSRLKKRVRIRKKVFGTAQCPRLSVFKSAKHIYAQIVDDTCGKTLVASSTRTEKASKGTGSKEAASRVGADLGKLAQQKNILTVVFDRGGYLYHGRVKALADAAREAGLKF